MIKWQGFIVLLLAIGWSSADFCPPADLFQPCTCNYDFRAGGNRMYCENIQQFNNSKQLKAIFQRISDHTRANEKHFVSLIIANSQIEELGSYLVANLTFDLIDINGNEKLRKIHWQAFNNPLTVNKRLSSFSLRGSPKYSLSTSPNNIFQMLNSFVNIWSIQIENADISEWPQEGLKILPKLKYLIISNYNNNSQKSIKIANQAFYNLSNLTQLTLIGQRLSFLSYNTFKFGRQSNQTLSLYLFNNKFNSTSFTSGWLNNINRPVQVKLSNNQITFLDQRTFKPFLDINTRSTISDLLYNPLNCSDCRNAWLKKGQNKYQTRVNNAYCNGKFKGPTIFDTNFDYCDNGDDLNPCKTKPELFQPCTCIYNIHFGGNQLFCKNLQFNNSKQLKAIFQRISDHTKANEKHFVQLVIENTTLEEFESNMIANLTFDIIDIKGNEKLRKIHWQAFSKPMSTVNKRLGYFQLRNSPKYSLLSWPNNLFQMLNSFVNVTSINIENIDIRHWPSEVFKLLPSLKYLAIRNNNLNNRTEVSFTDRAFYNLPNLTQLTLMGQRISFLPQYAFKFSGKSNQTLLLFLFNNNLNSSSFSSSWLNNINRPVQVNLAGNRITFLDRSVFIPFLHHPGNKINDLSYNPLNCNDCRNAWLKKNQDKYKTRVNNAYCYGRLGGPTIFDSKFDHCGDKEDDSIPCKTKPELFSPCKCLTHSNNDSVIVCDGRSKVDLQQLFKRISSQSRQKYKYFKKLIINNNLISELVAKTTEDLIFDEIEIAGESLTRIHSEAFLRKAHQVVKFTVTEETPLLTSGQRPYNVFELLNLFSNAKELTFLAPNVDYIPAMAFKKLPNLKTLNFGRVILKSDKRLSIGNGSFYNLEALTQLNLKLNRINKIQTKTFYFSQKSSERLTLSLARNDLNESSFQLNSLTGFKRPTSIDLNYNRIHYLDKNVFKLFLDLDDQNQIVDLSYNPLNCSDCQNYWLVEEKEKYLGRVRKAFCDGVKNEDVIFDRIMDHCKSKN